MLASSNDRCTASGSRGVKLAPNASSMPSAEFGPGRASDHGSGGGSAGSRRARRGAKRTLVSEVAALVCVLFAYR
jgi:hypothetical protein